MRRVPCAGPHGPTDASVRWPRERQRSAGPSASRVSAHLHVLARPLTRPAAPLPGRPLPRPPRGRCRGRRRGTRSGSACAGRALGCLLRYAAARARTGAALLDEILHVVADRARATRRSSRDRRAPAVPPPSRRRVHCRAPGAVRPHPRPDDAGRRMAALGRVRLLDSVRGHLPGSTGSADVLGDPVAAWTELAVGPDGAARLRPVGSLSRPPPTTRAG